MLYRLTIDAFHATPHGKQAMSQLAADPLFAKSRIGLHDGGLAAAVVHYQGLATPQLVIVEETDSDPVMLERLAQLAEVCVSGTRVVVAGQVNDITVYRTLLAQGVSDYLVAPDDAGLFAVQLTNSIAAMFADPAAAPRGRMIAFYGARGGVGSSSLAQNVAWDLARGSGEEVIYLDLDLAFGTSGLVFNADARQTVGELLGEPERIDAQLLDRILVKQDDHLRLLPAAAELRAWPPIEVEAIEHLFDLVRRMAPLLVVDLPHLWAPWISHSLESADEVVVTATPDLAALRESKTLLDFLASQRAGKTAARLVLNKLDAFKRSQLTAKDFAETLKTTPALCLALDPLFVEAANNGQMLAERAKSHKISEAIAQFAASLSGHAPAKAAKSDPLSAWLKRTGLVK